VEKTSTAVDETIQYLRRYFEVEESEIAPMRGWAISPLMGPANQTSDVSCSETPKVNKKGVPYPSSTVQAICAPAIEILKNIKSFVVKLLVLKLFVQLMIMEQLLIMEPMIIMIHTILDLL